MDGHDFNRVGVAFQPELVLFTTRDVDRQAVNRHIREAGLSPLHNIARVVRLEQIPALGTGKTDDNGKKIPFEVKVGDRVIYAKYAGTEIEIEGEDKKWLILKESDILATVER